MAPYTPDLRRREMTRCSAASSTAANGVNDSAATNNNNPYSNGNEISGSRVMMDDTIISSSYLPSERPEDRRVYNNPTTLKEGQLKHYLCQTADPFRPSSSNEGDDCGGEEWRSLKCVLVGDAAVGKTSLIVSYTTNGYPQEYVPTAFDNYSVSVRVDNQPIKLQLCDTAGQDDFDNLRPLCYPNADVFLVCFSVVNPTSFENVQRRWLPEIRNHITPSGTPFILVGTECDLRTNIKVLLDLHRHQLCPISEAQAEQLAVDAGAAAYLECSSLTLQNLKETFDAAILIGLRRGCSTAPNNAAKERQYRRSRTSSGHSASARKSFQKLKDKLTASRTNSIDSVRNNNVSNGWKGGAQYGGSGDEAASAAVAVHPIPTPASERYSTHSSASHVMNHMNRCGGGEKKKLSTSSVPITTGAADLNNVVMMNMNGDDDGRFYPVDQQQSPSMKSRKGWRKLLCVV